MSAPIKLTLEEARLAWITAQGIGTSGKPRLLPTLERTGFLRTLSGIEVYLAARARVPGLKAKDLDAAVARHDAQVVPAVRGCIYLVAKKYVPLALRIADSLSRSRTIREHEKAGVKKGELEKLGEMIVQTLQANGPLTTDALRKALPDGAVRSLGEAGKKMGITSTLPAALRLVEFEGRVERTLEGGRLDSSIYLWRTTEKSPFDGADLPDDDSELHARIAEVFFRAAGLGSIKQFAAWAGISQKEANAAADRLELVPVEIEGVKGPFHALGEFTSVLKDVEAAREVIGFVGFEDNLLALQGGTSMLVDAAHHGIEVPSWGSSKNATLGDAKHLSTRALVAEGRVAGLWEYDPDQREVVFSCFAPVSSATKKRLESEAAALGKFITDELGHGLSFSLDTNDELRKRADFVRRLSAPAPSRKRRS